jgi:DNA-binding SARP family transcriptional activator
MRFGVLGPLLVEDGPGGARTVAGARQRVLLAALLVRANHVVPAEGLAEIVWDGAPPPGAAALRTQVMRLRRGLGGEVAARVVTRDPGYVITLGEQELDITQFEALYREAGTAVRAGRWRDTVRAVSGALAL